MRDLDGRMAEITRRSQARMKQIKKRRLGVLMTCVPVVLCVTLFLGLGIEIADDMVFEPGVKAESDLYSTVENNGNVVQKEAYDSPESEGSKTDIDGINTDNISGPTLELITAGKRVKADTGSWYAEYTDSKGNQVSVDGGTDRPLERADITDPCITTDANAQLVFSETPDSVTIQCWPSTGAESDTDNSTQITAEGDCFRLHKGGYLYEIIAQWKKEDGSLKGIHFYLFVELTD